MFLGGMGWKAEVFAYVILQNPHTDFLSQILFGVSGIRNFRQGLVQSRMEKFVYKQRKRLVTSLFYFGGA